MSGRVAAYVMVTVGSADVETVCQQLLEFHQVKVAHPLIGPSDIICYVESDDLASFQETLDVKVRGLVDLGLVDKTLTLMVLQYPRERGLTRHDVNVGRGSAWILLDLGMANPETTVSQLLEVEGVRVAHAIVGPWDVIAFVETTSWEELRKFLDDRLRQVEGIRKTDTRPVLARTARSTRSPSFK